VYQWYHIGSFTRTKPSGVSKRCQTKPSGVSKRCGPHDANRANWPSRGPKFEWNINGTSKSGVEQRRAASSSVEQCRANVEQRRATSSDVEHHPRRATSSSVEQRRATSSNVEQRRAASSNVEQPTRCRATSSSLEQRRAASSSVEQRRATSSDQRGVERRRAASSSVEQRRATSSNVEQRRASSNHDGPNNGPTMSPYRVSVGAIMVPMMACQILAKYALDIQNKNARDTAPLFSQDSRRRAQTCTQIA
jgi:hypothetical protein